MKRKRIRLTEDDVELLETYQSLKPDDRKIFDIVIKIGASRILTGDEFHILIQNLMQNPKA